MPTALIYDQRFVQHDTGSGHPERPDRLRAIVQRLRATGLWDRLEHLSFEPADPRHIEVVHARSYVQRVRAACEAGDPYIDTADSMICPKTYEVALLAVGGALAAVDQVSAGHVRNAFCAVRPPGHHAEHDRSMGFCIFNNVAIAAEHLIREHGLERVAIIDFDVHHGNGTQHIFEDRADALYISIHEHPHYLYPGTGLASETGRGPGEGTTINLPVLPGAGDDVYRQLFQQRVIPALDDFSPQALLISAGFDACKDDPLAHVELSAEGFGWMTRQLRDAAERHCGGRLISMLEGGYDLRSLAECVAVHVGVLLGDAHPDHTAGGGAVTIT